MGPTTATRRSLASTAFTSAFLPVLLVLCLVAHVALFRRHGITTPAGSENRPVATFWPEQLFMDTVACALVLGVVIVLVLAEGGANLDAPADPASSDYPARPEWYFLSLFQMLKLFPGSREIIGTFVIPTALVVVMMLLPLLGPRASAQAGPFPGVRLCLRRGRRGRIPDRPGDARRRPR